MAKAEFTLVLNAGALAQIPHSPEAQHVLDRCADAALRYQQAAVPVLSGNLRRHLKIAVADGGLSRLVGILDGEVNYAAPVELGHETRSGSFVQAQPFIRPSLTAAKRGLNNGKSQ